MWSRAFPTSTRRPARRVVTSAGDVYNADQVERPPERHDGSGSSRLRAQVRPVGTRDPASRTIQLGYVVEEGPRVYIEAHQRPREQPDPRLRHPPRADVEGDAYNKVLVDRRAPPQQSRLLQAVRITNEPGSAPDRVAW